MSACEMICLTNSYRHGGRCLAGLRADGNGWVRPVDPSNQNALSRQHYTYADHDGVRVMDLLEVTLKEHRPTEYQPENWVVGDGRFTRLYRPAPSELAPILRGNLENGPTLFGDTEEKIWKGKFSAEPAKESLALIKPEHLEFRKDIKGKGQPGIRAVFSLGGSQHAPLWITDPVFEEKFDCSFGHIETDQPISATNADCGSNCLLTVSLAAPTPGGYCYKLVAAVVQLPAFWAGLV